MAQAIAACIDQPLDSSLSETLISHAHTFSLENSVKAITYFYLDQLKEVPYANDFNPVAETV